MFFPVSWLFVQLIRSQSFYPSHSQAISRTVVLVVSKPGVEPGPRPSRGRVRIRHTPRTFIVSSAGEIRTLRHWFLRPAAQPFAYRTKSATHTGFEPRARTEGWSLDRDRVASTPERTDGPCCSSSPGRIRTVDPLFVRQVPSPLGHRTMMLFVERRPDQRCASVPRSNPRVFPPTVFKTASSPIRVTSVSYDSKHRRQESNLRPSASNLRSVPGARRNYQQLLPRVR